MSPSRGVPDPTVLRAIAHPVRTRILGELAALGRARAADIARELAIPANQASFHLRQLAKYGLVEEAVGEGRDKRDRVWRPVDDGRLDINLRDLEDQPGGAAAVAVFRRTAGARAHALVDTAYAAGRAEETMHSVTDATLKLTKAEAQELSAEVQALVDRWLDRTRGGGAGRRSYSYLAMLQPAPDDDAD